MRELGLTRSVYYDWLERAQEGTLADRVVVPRPLLTSLPEEVEAAVAYAKAHPREGYRRLAWMMVDPKIAISVSERARRACIGLFARTASPR